MIIFLNTTVTHDTFVPACFFDKTVQPLLKLVRAFSRCLDISDTNTFIGFRKVFVVLPHDIVLPENVQDILRKHKRFLNDGKDAFPDLRMDQPVGVQPDQSLDIRPGISASFFSGAEAPDTMQLIQASVCTVDSAETKSLLNSVIIGKALLPGFLVWKDEPDLRRCFKMICQILPPCSAFTRAKSVHPELPSSTFL